jgi:hypothetical protein
MIQEVQADCYQLIESDHVPNSTRNLSQPPYLISFLLSTKLFPSPCLFGDFLQLLYYLFYLLSTKLGQCRRCRPAATCLQCFLLATVNTATHLPERFFYLDYDTDHRLELSTIDASIKRTYVKINYELMGDSTMFDTGEICRTNMPSISSTW